MTCIFHILDPVADATNMVDLRRVTRKNQRHACGVGDRAEVLRGRPVTLVVLYSSPEKFVKSFGAIEVVARGKYVLFRSTRIFADLVVMADCLRVALHLGRKMAHPLFFKTATDRRTVTHVAKVRTEEELAVIQPLIREAYDFSLSIPFNPPIPVAIPQRH